MPAAKQISATSGRMPSSCSVWHRCKLLAATSLITLLATIVCSEVSTAQPKSTDDPASTDDAHKPYDLRLGPFTYVGAFRVPRGKFGVSSFSYGGTALAFNPHRSSLFIVGHDHQQAVAEIEIPDIVNSYNLEDLKTAKVLQPFVQVLNRVPHNTLADVNAVKVGGLLVVDDQLIGSAFRYYDGSGSAIDSHFKLSSLNLHTSAVTGYFQVGNQGGGFVGGYMAEIPEHWRKKLGASYLTGQASLAVISRTSAGPAAFGFDPRSFGSKPSWAIPFVYYPLSTPLAKLSTENPIYNETSKIAGVVFPEQSDKLFFFGSHGTGPWWYGKNGDVPGLEDRFRPSKGQHAAPYTYQAWTYLVADLVAARNGSRRPWDVKPHEIWTFDFPFEEGSKMIGGVAYDGPNQRVFISQLFADRGQYNRNPIIHVFRVTASPTNSDSAGLETESASTGPVR